jgi:uncharacterized protein
MTSYFLDLNVWLALSDAGNAHSPAAWQWVESLAGDARLIFSRYTQLGLLRLLTNRAVMATQTLTIGQAWKVYRQWLGDHKVEFHPEPPGLEEAFRRAMANFDDRPAFKWVGDCYLVAHAARSGAVLVTFDKPLAAFARKSGHAALVPGSMGSAIH